MDLLPATNVNLFLGENGSGKTSVLEAIYLLGLGRSFRSRSLKHLVQHEQPLLQVIAKCDDGTPLGLQYHLRDGLQIRLNNAPLRRLSDLATQLPVQYIPANCHQFFELGPKYRRRLIDWGVFHVEPDYNYHWQSYKKSLQQRNAALKSGAVKKDLLLWDKYLDKHGKVLTELREKYLQMLADDFVKVFNQICPSFKTAEITARFSTGWQKNEALIDVLQASIERDRLIGYTRAGAHACDWTLRINDGDPSELLSRGQQKLFFLAISLAQLKQVNNQFNTAGILLIDDLSSELDDEHQLRLLEYIESAALQTFITTTNSKLEDYIKDKDDSRVFHVKHGQLT